MRRVFKRIAINGSLTALALGCVGLLYAEMAGIWLGGSGGRGSPQGDAEFAGQLRSRVPVVMAAWGFGFIALAEVLLFLVRGEPGARAAKAAKAADQPDDAELLLEELLRQAEAKMAQEKVAAFGAGLDGHAGAPAQKPSPEEAGASILNPDLYAPPPTP
jgi:hypothetical protein